MTITIQLAHLTTTGRRATMRRDSHYLRLVEPISADEHEPCASEYDGTLLGFIDMSQASDVALETIMFLVQPAWVFDLRPVPYFNIGRLTRRRMFELFRNWKVSYRDIAGSLRITKSDDARLNSGAVGSFLNQIISMHPVRAPIVVLVDHQDALSHAMDVLPRCLRSSLASSWCPRALDIHMRNGAPDLVLRTAHGESQRLQMQWLGDRSTR